MMTPKVGKAESMWQKSHLFENAGEIYRLNCQFFKERTGAPSDFVTRIEINLQGSSGQPIGSGFAYLISIKQAWDCAEPLSKVFLSLGEKLANYYSVLFDLKSDFYKKEFSSQPEDLLIVDKLELSPEVASSNFLHEALIALFCTAGNFGMAITRPARLSSKTLQGIVPSWSRIGFRPTGTTGFWWATFRPTKQSVKPSLPSQIREA